MSIHLAGRGPRVARPRAWACLLLGLLASGPAMAIVCYVDGRANGANDGSSWVDAYFHLRDALANVSCTDIRVASFTYQPQPVVTASFQLRNGVTIRGGFPEGGGTLAQRDWEANPTILTGFILANDNSYQVVNGSGTDATAVLDGFTITRGIADGPTQAQASGGGIYIVNGSPTLANLVITNNEAGAGAGIFIDGGSPTLTNVRFSNNTATFGAGMFTINGAAPMLTDVSFTGHTVTQTGGTIYNNGASPVLVDVQISNSTAVFGGGAIYNQNAAGSLTNVIIARSNAGPNAVGGGMENIASSPTLHNVVFRGNRASSGGAMSNSDGSAPVLTNVTFSGNQASFFGGAIINNDSSPTLRNVVVWNNQANGSTSTLDASISNGPGGSPTVSHSLVANCNPSGLWFNVCGINGGNNLRDADPRFVTPVDPATAPTAAGDLRLLPLSPAIDVGDNAANATGTDPAGTPRIVNTTIDLGAYEYPGSYACPAGGRVHIDALASPTGNGESWATAFNSLQAGLQVAPPCEVWVAAGLYKPTPNPADRNARFALRSGVGVYGGFAGTETARSQRDHRANLTVLSGDIDNNDTVDGDGVVASAGDMAGANSYNVVAASGVAASGVLDGFTITAGMANGGTGITQRGGGLVANAGGGATLANLAFSGNLASFGGGGLFTSTSLSLTNASFRGNSATSGGGIFSDFLQPVLTNVSFSGNAATDGGGLYNLGGLPTLTNVSFSGNQASEDGGGMYSTLSAAPVLRNAIFWNNRDQSGTGTRASSVVNVNSSVPQFSHSLVQGCRPAGVWTAACGTDGGNNLADVDPRFVASLDPATAPSGAGDLRLLPGSPATDVGDDAVNGTGTDLAGNTRIVGGTIDLGAYEYPRSFACPAGGRVHVGQPTDPVPDGQDWAGALEALRLALDVEAPCEVWVAAGVHKPFPNTSSRRATFTLRSGVAVYGGFAGTELARAERDPRANVTVLSGDLGGDDAADADGVVGSAAGISGTNSLHVVTASGTDASAVLDGFTITAGNANGGGPAEDQRGGGMTMLNGSPTLSQLRIVGNQATTFGGGGLYNQGGSPVLSQVEFSGNRASRGGGMESESGQPVLVNVSFRGNRATDSTGGGLRNSFGEMSLTSVVFAGNLAQTSAGAVFSSGAADDTAALVINNAIFWNNQDGSGVGTQPAAIVQSNTSTLVSHSLVQGCRPAGVWNTACGVDVGNNLDDVDPMFAATPDPANAPSTSGDLRLLARSPAVDVGSNAANATSIDLDGEARVFGGTIDLGPRETRYLVLDLGVAGPGSGSAALQSPLPARFDAGEQVTVLATPAISSDFGGWSGDLASPDNPLAFAINADTSLVANFVLRTFEVSAATSGDGSGSITPALQTVSYDGSASFTVAVDAGSALDSVTGDTCTPVDQGGGSWSAASITADCTVTASFSAIATDLQVAKDDGQDTVLDGQQLVYAITVTNAGPLPVTGAVLADLLPADLVEAEWACQPAESNTACPAPPFDAGSGDLLAEIDLPVGGFLRYDLMARVQQATAGVVVANTATVATPDGVAELDPDSNAATDNTLVIPEAIFINGFEAGAPKLTVPAAAKAHREALQR